MAIPITVGLLVLLKLLEMSPFNDFGNEIIITSSDEEREKTVERVARRRMLKPRWRVEDSKTKQVFLVKWRKRVHVLNSTNQLINDFVAGQTTATAEVLIFGSPRKRAEQYISSSEGSLVRYEALPYMSDEVKEGSMYLLRESMGLTTVRIFVVRRWGPRMGGGLRRYKGREL